MIFQYQQIVDGCTLRKAELDPEVSNVLNNFPPKIFVSHLIVLLQSNKQQKTKLEFDTEEPIFKLYPFILVIISIIKEYKKAIE